MTMIFRPGVRMVMPGATVVQPRGGAAVDWWDPNGESLSVVAAYLAKGAASYAASKVNLANPGTYDATNGAGVPDWNTASGWTGTSGAVKYLDTGLFPTQDWTMLVQFANSSSNACCGVISSGQRITIAPYSGANRTYYYGSVGRNVAGPTASGNMCVAGGNFYLNGSVDASPISSTFTCSNNARLVTAYGSGSYIGDVYAVAFYSGTLTPAQVATVAAAMAAL